MLTVEEEIKELEKYERAQTNAKDFTELVIKDDKTGNPLVLDEIHNEIIDFFDSIKEKGLLLIPRKHGKTTIVKSYAIHSLGKDTRMRIKVVSNTDEMAKAKIRFIKYYIENSIDLHEVFPDLMPGELDWTKHKFTVDRPGVSSDSSVEAWSILSSSTGGQADLLIFDDPVDFRNAIQFPKMRETIKRAFYSTWIPLLADGGKLIYIATTWHEDDLTSELRNDPEYEKLIRPIVDFKPIWPNKWNAPKLQNKRKSMKKSDWERNYELKPVSDEDHTFQEKDVDSCVFDTRSPSDISSDWPRFMGVDLAIGKRSDASFSAFFILARDPEGNLYPVEMGKKRLGSIATARRVVQLQKIHWAKKIMVETNAYQKSFLEWIKTLPEAKDTHLPLKAYFTQLQKRSLAGIDGMALDFEQGKWKIFMGRKHSVVCKCIWCEWIKQLKNWPNMKEDDLVMACFFAREAAKTGTKGFRYRSGGQILSQQARKMKEKKKKHLSRASFFRPRIETNLKFGKIKHG